MSAYRFQLTTALILFIGGLVFFYFFTGVFGGATIDVTIGTNPNLENGLVGHWTFDGKNIDWASTTAEIVDRSGNGNNGNAIVSNNVTVPGRIGQALSFDGNLDYVDIGNSASVQITGSLTVLGWIKLNSFNASLEDDTLIGKHGNSGASWRLKGTEDTGPQTIGFEFSSDGSVGCGTCGHRYGATLLSVGQWYHFAAVYNATAQTADVYLNGVLDNGTLSATVPASLFNSSESVGIGADTAGSLNEVNGYVDDIRLYNRALSASEIKRLYELGATTKIAKTITTNPDLKNGLIGHWTFDGPETDWASSTAEVIGRVNDIDGDVSGATRVRGKIGQALEFDGTNDYVLLGKPSQIINLTPPFTVALWIYPRADENAAIFSETDFVGGAGDEWITADTNGQIIVYLNRATNDLYMRTTSGAVMLNAWNHVIVASATGVSSDTDIYVNGILRGETVNSEGSGSFGDSGRNVLIGGADDADNGSCSLSCFNGLIDDVRMYNRVLSQEELKRLYELGATTHIGTTITTNADLKNGLIGHWTFDGNLNTTVTDISGQGNHGYVNGVATTSAVTHGMLGQALEFDGVDDYIIMPSNTWDFSGGLSFAAWVKPENVSSFQAIWSPHNLGGQPYFELSGTTGEFDCGCGNAEVTSSGAGLVAGEWYHLAATCDKATDVATLYKNGVQVKQTGFINADDTFTQPTAIGANTLFDTYFDGAIDDVRVYNRALSATEIKRLYELGR